MTLLPPPADRVLTVAQITEQIAGALRGPFRDVWVAGEISNLVVAGSGHAYLTLKDESAQLRAVIWRPTVSALPFQLTDGLDVLARGSIDVYAGRGQYQLTVRQLLPKGIGPLELAFRQLREKLSREGLFDADRKRPIPFIPRRVAVVTSPRGAAVRDFLEVAGRRWQGAGIVVCPCAVQGDAAVAEILAALANAQRLEGVDVIALIRGGGSLEDLAAFNSEPVARAIAACSIPVVSGVGHEIDLTIADLVADVRALTPSEAAERIFPDAGTLGSQLGQMTERLWNAWRTGARTRRERLTLIEQSATFRYPLEGWMERVRELDEREADLLQSLLRRLESCRQDLALLAQPLDVLSPLANLSRGYALVSKEATGARVISCRQVELGEDVRVRLVDGTLQCRVTERKESADGGS